MFDATAASVGFASETIALDDLDLESLTLVELNEEVRGHPENLASSKMCCCCVSTWMML